MADYTDEVTGCERDVISKIDDFDVDRELLSTHIPLTLTLAQCGFGPQKLSIFRTWVNQKREAAGKEPLPASKVKASTKLREAIDHVCG